MQTKTRDSRQQAQRKLRLMKAMVMVVFGANAFCAGLCSIGYLYDFYIWVINTFTGSESAKHWGVFIVQAVSFLGGFLLFIHGLWTILRLTLPLIFPNLRDEEHM